MGAIAAEWVEIDDEGKLTGSRATNPRPIPMSRVGPGGEPTVHRELDDARAGEARANELDRAVARGVVDHDELSAPRALEALLERRQAAGEQVGPAVAHDDRAQPGHRDVSSPIVPEPPTSACEPARRREPGSVLHALQATPGGVPEVALNLVADQCRRGWRVALACPPELELGEPATEAGARYLPWPAERGVGRSLALETARFRAIHAQTQPELVHLHSSKAGLVGRAVIRGRRPTVFQPHAWSFEAVEGASRRLVVAWERFATRWADAIACVSEDERERGRRLGVRARWAVVPNGIDLTRYAPASEDVRAEARRALGLGEGPLAVTVGRLDVQKGPDVLLSAWRRVLTEVSRADLVLVGDGPLRAELELMRVPQVRFVGWRRDVDLWIAAADVVALASRWEAGLPLAAMEAMARERSVVATEVAGMGVVRDGGCGALVPVGATGELGAALAARLLDPDLARREGAAGRALVERAFSVEEACKRAASLYARVLGRRAAADRPAPHAGAGAT